MASASSSATRKKSSPTSGPARTSLASRSAGTASSAAISTAETWSSTSKIVPGPARERSARSAPKTASSSSTRPPAKSSAAASSSATCGRAAAAAALGPRRRPRWRRRRMGAGSSWRPSPSAVQSAHPRRPARRSRCLTVRAPCANYASSTPPPRRPTRHPKLRTLTNESSSWCSVRSPSAIGSELSSCNGTTTALLDRGFATYTTTW
mmetsp:Transcript_9592/g.39147  ORF Transcript_9592/g.39147 Transcript_9592/m.39147 type:complete len:208 (+) Transcript_9592:117-740(+)